MIDVRADDRLVRRVTFALKPADYARLRRLAPVERTTLTGAVMKALAGAEAAATAKEPEGAIDATDG